ncbi:amidohydrolase family protein [Clostridium formicaceticum]|uniref:Amidohydrolase n=1 Tax=Clostridium formicaceticum TaxID=1497 RepID=A0AAC9RPD6_9CLOT|nr:amidohydrolase family protein [Clostridium formicaceticum]AOY75260.1 amidohydrolase [Clostridium formicaceticum]ARE89696.1 Imidazolonepropionase [Clostridium formicaceticum]
MLIDAHIHVALNPLYNRQTWEAADREKKVVWLREILQQYKRRKIYILRDGGDRIFASKLAREVAKEEGMIYKSPIYALYKKGHYGSFLGKSIEGLEDFKKAFKLLLEHQPDHLKIILTGMVNFQKYGDVGETAFTLEMLKYMVEAAKDHNLPVMVHANGPGGVRKAIKAGAHTIEHGYLMSEAEVYAMAEKDIVWIPTLAPLGNILKANEDRFKQEREVIQKVYDGQLENIKKAIEIGTKVALGSDAGSYSVHHGSGLLDEIEHFQAIGIEEKEAEKIAFENGLKALNINRDILEKEVLLNL